MSSWQNFYPRSPCGERRGRAWFRCKPGYFYPRSPCGERRNISGSRQCGQRFLSTLSLRRATANTSPGPKSMTPISIHALLAESDNNSKINICYGDLISIHALLAESDALRSPRIALMVGFLSTLSLRRATTYGALKHVHEKEISIHALLAESDGYPKPGRDLGSNFYPRSPCGERHRSF